MAPLRWRSGSVLVYSAVCTGFSSSPHQRTLPLEERSRRVWDEDSRCRKEEVRRGMRRDLSERRWQAVLQEAEKSRHVSIGYLLRLMAAGGVPDHAGPHVAARFSGEIAPPGHPARPTLDPRDLDTLWDHFDGGTTPWPGVAARKGVESLFPSQFVAVAAVRLCHARYAAFETRREPRRANKTRLRYVESRGAWRVKDPKGEARRWVARHWSKVNDAVEPSTLAEWERRIRAWGRQLARAMPTPPPRARRRFPGWPLVRLLEAEMRVRARQLPPQWIPITDARPALCECYLCEEVRLQAGSMRFEGHYYAICPECTAKARREASFLRFPGEQVPAISHQS